MPTPGIKEQARKLVEELPDDATWEELEYKIYVRRKIEQGLESIEERTHPDHRRSSGTARIGRHVKLRWSTDSLNDLQDIYDYVRGNAPEAAQRVVEEIIESAARLETFPQSGRHVPEYADPSIREVIKAPYRIIYRVDEHHISVVAVLHAAKKLPSTPPTFE